VGEFIIPKYVQTGSGTLSATTSKGNAVDSPPGGGGKAAGSWRWPLPPTLCRDCVCKFSRNKYRIEYKERQLANLLFRSSQRHTQCILKHAGQKQLLQYIQKGIQIGYCYLNYIYTRHYLMDWLFPKTAVPKKGLKLTKPLTNNRTQFTCAIFKHEARPVAERPSDT